MKLNDKKLAESGSKAGVDVTTSFYAVLKAMKNALKLERNVR